MGTAHAPPIKKNRLEKLSGPRTPHKTCSEHYLQTELHHARGESCGRLPKILAAHVTSWVPQIHSVEKVECVRTELDLNPLRHHRVLDQRQIDVLERRPTKRVPAKIAILAHRDTLRTEPRVDGSIIQNRV